MSTLSTDSRRRRKHSIAMYGVTLITIALVVIVAQVVGHQAGDLYSKVSTGLSL
jgi:t-SNARE complex subunit (syntaxin)